MNFLSDGTIKKINYLEDFTGDLPEENYVLTSSDYKYYLKYGEKFITSALSVGHRVHLHIFNPEDELLERDGVTVTTSTLIQDKNYGINLTTSRFFLWKKLLNLIPYRFWAFDIDGYFNDKFLFNSNNIGIYLRFAPPKKQERNFTRLGWDLDGRYTYLAIFYISPENVKFLDEVIADLNRSKNIWSVDQGSLYRAYMKYKDEYNFFQVDRLSVNQFLEHEVEEEYKSEDYKFYHYGKGQDI